MKRKRHLRNNLKGSELFPRISVFTILLLIADLFIFRGFSHSEIIDAVIAIDDSNFMKDTDPQGMRYVAANLIREYLYFYNQSSLITITFWGTYPESAGKELQIRSEKTCVAERMNESSYLSLKDTPIGCFRDFVHLLEGIKNELEGSSGESEEEREKYIFIITSGTHTPWPGDPRFGDLSERFKRFVEDKKKRDVRYIYNPEGPQNEWQREAIERDKKVVESIINDYRERGWRVYVLEMCGERCIHDEFLAYITRGTNGYIIQGNEKEIIEKLKEILPPLPEIGIILLETNEIRCDGRDFLFEMGRGFNHVMTFVNFGRGGGIGEDELGIKVVSPSREEYTPYTTRENFRLYKEEEKIGLEKRKRVKVVVYEIESPEEGRWKISVSSQKDNECGDIYILGKRNQRMDISLSACRNVEKEILCEPGINTDIEVKLINPENEVSLPFDTAECRMRGIIDVDIPPLEKRGDAGAGNFRLPSPEGSYALQCMIMDHTFHQQIKGEIDVKIEEVPLRCSYPEEMVMIGRLGSVESERCATKKMEVTCEKEKDMEVSLIPALFVLKGKDTYFSLEGWDVEFHPAEVKVPFTEFDVKICLPENINFALVPNDVYKGKIEMFKKGAEIPMFSIPVGIHVQIPSIAIHPEEVSFNYLFRFLNEKIKKRLKVETEVSEPVDGKIHLPDGFKMEGSDEIVKEVSLDVFYKENGILKRFEGGRLKIPGVMSFIVSVNLSKIPKWFEKRIRGKILTGELRITSSYAREGKARLKIKIPKLSIPKKYIWTAFLGYTVLLLFLNYLFPKTSPKRIFSRIWILFLIAALIIQFKY